jgi:MEDS: MEthanogen/methylotroph, DcmR Sensory domain
VIATAEHSAAFTRKLAAAGIDVRAARDTGRLVTLDAGETLAGFMVNGSPDRERFDATVGTTVRALRARIPGGALRAYGEMVGLLWRAGEYAAAIKLEALWNALLRDEPIRLYCAYPIDVFGKEFCADDVDALLGAHTHLVPAAAELADAVDEAIGEVLGPAAATLLKTAMDAGEPPASAALPPGEATILWLRKHLPDYAPEIVARARTRCRAAA